MALDKRRRDAHFIELAVKTDREDGPNVTVEHVVQTLQKMLSPVTDDTPLGEHPVCAFYNQTGAIISSDDLEAEADAGRARVIFLHKIKMVGKAGAVLLFRYATTSGSDPAYFHLEKKTVREFKKRKGEANAYAGHLYIDWLNAAAHGGARVVLERVPGLSQTAIFTLLNRKLKERAEDDPTFTHKSRKTGKSEPFRPILKPAYVANQDLASALECGEAVLERVVFARRPKEDESEEGEGVFDLLGEEKEFVIRAHSDGSIKEALAQKWKEMRGQGYNAMRIRYRASGFPRARSQKFSAGEEENEATDPAPADPVENGVADSSAEKADEMSLGLLIHVEECEFSSDLSQCPDEFVDAVVNKFEALAKKDGIWK